MNLYAVDVVRVLRFEQHAYGRPFHAARTRLPPRAADTEAHRHADFCEVMAVTAGRGLHLLDGGPRELVAGDVVFVRRDDRHAFRPTAPDGLEFVNVAFPSSRWNVFAELLGRDAFDHAGASEPPHRRLNRPAGSDPVGPSTATTVFELFERTLLRFREDPSMLDLVRFWTDLLSLLPGPDSVRPRDLRPPWLARACAAMRTEPNLRAGLPRLRQLAGVSAAHLSRCMRCYDGRSPTEFLTGLRLEHAVSLLATTTEPLAVIAHRCGFSGQSHFTRRFRQAYAMTPREFRRRTQRALVP